MEPHPVLGSRCILSSLFHAKARRVCSAEWAASLHYAPHARASPVDFIGFIHPYAEARPEAASFGLHQFVRILPCREGERVPRPAPAGHCPRLPRAVRERAGFGSTRAARRRGDERWRVVTGDSIDVQNRLSRARLSRLLEHPSNPARQCLVQLSNCRHNFGCSLALAACDRTAASLS